MKEDPYPELSNAKALLKSGRTAAAAWVLASLVKREGASARVLKLHSRALSQLGRHSEAVGVARAANEKVPHNRSIQTLLGEMLIRAGRAEEAERFLSKACRKFSQHAPLWAVLAEARFANGATTGALDAITRAAALRPDDPKYACKKGEMLIAAHAFAGAEQVLREAATRFPDVSQVFKPLSMACMKLGRWAEAADAAEKASCAEPKNFWLRKRWAECLLWAERPQEALDVITAARARTPGNTDRAVRLMILEGHAHVALGDVQEAIEVLQAASRLRPNNEHILRPLATLLGETDRVADANRLIVRLNRNVARRLPDNLAEALQALRTQLPNQEVSTRSMDWAWGLADQSKWDWRQWWEAAEWSRRANLLLADWWRCAPEKADEIEALVDAADFTTVRNAAQDRGCLLVGAHVGPFVGGMQFLCGGDLRFRTIGFAGPNRIEPEDSSTRISVTTNSVATARELIREIKRGTIIGLMSDSPQTADCIEREFLGHRIGISTLAPRLMRKLGVASFWYHSAWCEDRIQVRIEPLPDPRENEAADAWIARWSEHYLEKLEAAMRGRPENLGLGHAGIWRTVHPARWTRKIGASSHSVGSDQAPLVPDLVDEAPVIDQLALRTASSAASRFFSTSS